MRMLMAAGLILLEMASGALARPIPHGPYIANCMVKLTNVNIVRKREGKAAFAGKTWAKECEADYAVAQSINRPWGGNFNCFPLSLTAQQCRLYKAAHP